ncbi:MAG: substrate-binding domain-containing protein, partial [Actinomycetota bacterium]|nr:substrate-binding domain-containing protein [Actinomycetota bacterium]
VVGQGPTPARRRSADPAWPRAEAARLGSARSGRRRRFASPIGIGVLLLLGLGLVGTGYALVASRCDGLVRLTVVASPDHAGVLEGLAQRWSDTNPAVGGRCVRVDVVSKRSDEMAYRLSASWDTRRDGRQPDVWAPDASTWLQRARNGDALLGSRNPSLARTPVVVAMPRPMAEALGWPDQQIGWLSLVKQLQDPAGWAAFGHPEWGPMRLGIADPVHDTAALAAVLAVVNYDGDQAVSPTELAGARSFEKLVSTSAPATTDLLIGVARAASAGTPLRYLSAFPATERDVIRYNATNPAAPLVADYPPDGAASADHPYAVLQAQWVDQAHRAVAKRFLSFLRGRWAGPPTRATASAPPKEPRSVRRPRTGVCSPPVTPSATCPAGR